MPHYNQNQWVERNDNIPGWVYLLEAAGYHGVLPGVYLRRCKIGLTRSVENRLDTLHSSQPCCNYKVLKAIYVEDMASVEAELHRVFKNSNVKLKKSREWHDLYPWQLAKALWLMSRYEQRNQSKSSITKKAVVGGLIALLGTGIMLSHALRPETPQAQTTSTEQEKLK